MNYSQNVRRFRANPIEVVIFSVVSLVFVSSVYRLFYDHQGFHPTILSPMSSNPISEGRNLASVQPLSTLDFSCQNSADQESSANKVRLAGPLCGTESDIHANKLIEASITNTANQFKATVFTDLYSGKFSTDYIQLLPGKNPVHLEFSYLGKTVVRDFTINKP